MNLAEIGAWAASAISLTSVWLYGSKRLIGPALGACAFVPWMMVALGGPVILWGLVPANFAYFAIHIRNLIRWHKERSS